MRRVIIIFVLVILTMACNRMMKRTVSEEAWPQSLWFVNKKANQLDGKLLVAIRSLEKSRLFCDTEPIPFRVCLFNTSDSAISFPLTSNVDPGVANYDLELIRIWFCQRANWYGMYEGCYPLKDSLNFKSPFRDSFSIQPHDSVVINVPFYKMPASDVDCDRYKVGFFKGHLTVLEHFKDSTDNISMLPFKPVRTVCNLESASHFEIIDTIHHKKIVYNAVPIVAWVNDNIDHFGLYYSNDTTLLGIKRDSLAVGWGDDIVHRVGLFGNIIEPLDAKRCWSSNGEKYVNVVVYSDVKVLRTYIYLCFYANYLINKKESKQVLLPVFLDMSNEPRIRFDTLSTDWYLSYKIKGKTTRLSF